MKKDYITPFVEKICFDYKDQIVTGSSCTRNITSTMPDGATKCMDDEEFWEISWVGNNSF